jgi:hypothetical protein
MNKEEVLYENCLYVATTIHDVSERCRSNFHVPVKVVQYLEQPFKHCPLVTMSYHYIAGTFCFGPASYKLRPEMYSKVCKTQHNI